MALNIHKPEVQLIAQPEVEVAPIQGVGLAKPQEVQSVEEALVIEMLDLEKKIRMVEADKMLKRKEEIRKQLLGTDAVKEADPTLPYSFDADEGKIVFSACSNKVEITDMPGLVKKIGLDTFLEIASVTVTDLKKVLSENEIAQFSEKKQGSRTLKAVEPT